MTADMISRLDMIFHTNPEDNDLSPTTLPGTFASRSVNGPRWDSGLHSNHTLNPTPYTLHPTPYTQHPTPYTLHSTLNTLHPIPSTPYILHSQHPAPNTEQRQRAKMEQRLVGLPSNRPQAPYPIPVLFPALVVIKFFLTCFSYPLLWTPRLGFQLQCKSRDDLVAF